MNPAATTPMPSPTPTLRDQQAALLQALLAREPSTAHLPFTGVANNSAQTSAAGLNAYKSNAGALAERVLVAAYPAVTAILGSGSMGQLARALWHAHPPQRGDLAHWGDALPGFMAASDQLAHWPWLPDVARVEWALHAAASAADDPPAAPDSLGLLATQDPDTLTLTLATATQVHRLDWTSTRIVLAHRPELVGGDGPGAEAADEPVNQLGPVWATPAGEWALTWRGGLRPRLRTVGGAEAAFVKALLAGQSLLAALESCELDFADWLPRALQAGWVRGVAQLAGQSG